MPSGRRWKRPATSTSTATRAGIRSATKPFTTKSELIAGEGGDKLSPQGTPVEWTDEETWFFRLSKYQQPLLDLYAANPGFIQPESRRNEVMRFVEGGLKDLSVSRTSFDWGVPVPGIARPRHVRLGRRADDLHDRRRLSRREGDWARYWPADVHLIGKDIVRFHAVYWPAFLMSAGLPLPRQVYAHGFLLARGEKMSKSLGNVVDPMELAERFGVDALRYFLLREVTFGQDGSYSAEAIVARVNAELANSFGNLAQRTLSMIFKNLDGVLPDAGAGRRGQGACSARSSGPAPRLPRSSSALPFRRASKRGWRRSSPATPTSTPPRPGR